MSNLALDGIFPRYEQFDPLVPVWCITPRIGRVIHRFFNTSPISPSGRYAALTRLPFEDAYPAPGDVAEIVVVDLREGTHRVVAETRGWDTQLGAQTQWGTSDDELYFNDLDPADWVPYGVRMNPHTGEARRLEGTIYMVSPDGTAAVSACLRRIGATQAGYGVLVPASHIPVNRGAPADDGVYVTDLASGKTSLLISYRDIVEQARPPIDVGKYGAGDFYGFHVKWSPDGERIMLVLRYKMATGGYAPQLITMKRDGTDVRVAVPLAEWADKGGHHPIWCPDGQHIMMNLKTDRRTLRLIKVRYDGSGYGTLSDRIVGSGHPSMRPDGRFIVTDAYLDEDAAYGDGTVPIRFIDPQQHREAVIIRIATQPPTADHRLRIDPHPVWDKDGRRLVFNGFVDGTRRVFLAEMPQYPEQGWWGPQ